MSTIYQQGSYSTLYGGFYEGTIKMTDALKHGNVGIGTLDGADGEVIILDGVAYHGNSENQVRVVEGNESLPYVAVIEHRSDLSFRASNLDEIVAKLPSKNIAYSIAISGTFKSVEISSKPADNHEPYLDILAKQPHFTKENVKGTIVGIWSPEHLSGLYGNGFHLHFLSEDKTFGAHLVGADFENLNVEIGKITRSTQDFPADNEKFLKMKL